MRSSQAALTPSKTELHSRRLLLREARDDDAEDLFDALRSEDVMRYWSSPAHQSIDDTRAWLKKMTDSPHNGVVEFVVVLQQPSTRGLVVGKCGCWDGREIGFLLHSDYWGQGYASEAIDAVVDHVWRTSSLDAITADVDPRNTASLRLLKKKGFVVERLVKNTMTTHIGECDSAYLRLDRPSGIITS